MRPRHKEGLPILKYCIGIEVDSLDFYRTELEKIDLEIQKEIQNFQQKHTNKEEDEESKPEEEINSKTPLNKITEAIPIPIDEFGKIAAKLKLNSTR